LIGTIGIERTASSAGTGASAAQSRSLSSASGSTSRFAMRSPNRSASQ
jgi:hypothetical protein